MIRNFTNLLQVALVLLMSCVSISTSIAQTESQRRQITNNYDKVKLNQMALDYRSKALSRKNEALRLAAVKGWDVLRKNPDGTFDELMAVTADGHPVYYTIYNADAARSTRTNHLHNGGSLGLDLEGQGLTAHVWDGGPTRPTHQEFDGAGGDNRVTINDGITVLNDNSFHAQHVTGTIVASGVDADARGMAPQARALTHDWDDDLAEATTEAANGMLISNHSYGWRAQFIPDWWFGAYIEQSRDWDELMFNSPNYLMVVAAGNDGDDNSSNGDPLNNSYDKLNGHTTSKNNLVVANANDATINNDGTFVSVSINSSSSEGPTDDMRIKPDITGNGTDVFSSYDGADDEYGTISGTSMASPNVAGSLLLLQQQYNDMHGRFMRAATLKGLALHTADDAGTTGPDVIYGWGLLNARKASQTIAEDCDGSFIQELTLQQGETYTLRVDAFYIEDLKVSISWTDPAGVANTGIANDNTPVLVNDLDVRVTQLKTGNVHHPWRLATITTANRGNNTVDPFERVDVSNSNGLYDITVTHKGNLQNGSQDFTLIVTGTTRPRLTTPKDFRLEKDYFYVLRWSDVNAECLTGSVEILRAAPGSNTYQVIETRNDIHDNSTYVLGRNVPTGKYRLRFRDQFGRVLSSSIIDTEFKAPTNLKVINPYYYNLTWSDVNEDFWTGTIQVQRNYHPTSTSFYTIGTISNLNTQGYYLGTAYPEFKYRLKFTSSTGIVKYSNIADEGQVKPVTDLEVIKPYYYNLSWTDPNAAWIEGTMDIEVNYYYDIGNWFHLGTIDMHSTTYYIGTNVGSTYRYRLKMYDYRGNPVYSNLAASNLRTGQFEVAEEDDLQLYPIPASGTLNFRLQTGETTGFSIMDLKGNTLIERKVPEDYLFGEQTVDISMLDAGMYLFQINGKVKRFVVQ